MLKGFYQTDKNWIVSESKKVFGVDVCGTCHGQLVKAYNNLANYYKNENQMAKTTKKEQPIEVKETVKYKLKPEFEGSTFTDGVKSISLSSIDQKDIELLLTKDQILIHFDVV